MKQFTDEQIDEIGRHLIEAWKLAGQIDQCRSEISKAENVLDAEPSPGADSAELTDDSVSRAIDWARSRDDGDDSPAKVLADAITSLRAQLTAERERAERYEKIIEGEFEGQPFADPLFAFVDAKKRYRTMKARAEAAEADAKALREALQGLAVGGMTPVWYETKARAALFAHEDKP
jgi:hypothetical protein